MIKIISVFLRKIRINRQKSTVKENMSEQTKSSRLGKAAQEFNVAVNTIVDFLNKKGIKIDNKPNTKLAPEVYALLIKEFQSQKTVKESSQKIEIEYHQHKTISLDDKKTAAQQEKEAEIEPEVFIRNMPLKQYVVTKPKEKEEKPVEPPTPEIPGPVIESQPEPEAEPETETEKESETAPTPEPEIVTATPDEPEEAPVPAIEMETPSLTEQQPEVTEETEEDKPEEITPPEVVESGTGQLKVLGKIDLDEFRKPSKKSKSGGKKDKKTAPKSTKKTPVAAEPPSGEKAEPEKADELVAEKPPISTPVTEQTTAVKAEETPVPDAEEKAPEQKSNFMKTEVRKLEGPTILGSMKLPEPRRPEAKKPVASSSDDSLKAKKKKRKRIKKHDDTTAGTGSTPATGGKTQHASTDKKRQPRDRKSSRQDTPKVELTPEDIQRQIKETLQRLSSGGKSKASKHRREKRSIASQQQAQEAQKREEDMKSIMVAEFVTANELANLMDVPVTEIISTCLSLGLFVSINQRLDAETIVVVADEFGFSVKFVGVEDATGAEEEEMADDPADLLPRAPIVTVMGHVDHGKTSLLDYIRNANVIAGEAGGITQHIGAYEVKLENDRKITFLDTPGHEAFTAMRARGAKITDIVIIVIAADDTVMPQTIEAINHAQAANVPIVFAINKMDKPSANAEKIREELSKRNILVEDWGGKYQSQEISAKKGTNVDLLLEKVLLEAEMLDLKANPKRPAHGTILESSLDKGRGYVAKILVQTGTLKQGDLVMAGITMGRVKAMYNERNQAIKEAGPSSPLLLLGLNGAPQAGDTFKVMQDEREAKNIVAKRHQLQREQGIRTQKHITLDEIGRRIAIGDFKELNIIVKGDVDGSVEALSDSLLKLSNEEVQVNIIHKSVGAVTESDVLLASASNAVIIGFQVRPSMAARKLAEQEQIDIRLYSIIYTAINEIKAAIEGMLSPDIEEKIVCNLEVRDVFKITKVGTVAGCMVLDGKIHRNTKIRIIRDGIVIHTGVLGSLKRFKDDVKEVSAGYECGLNVENFNDIRVRDIIEGYEEVEVKRKL